MDYDKLNMYDYLGGSVSISEDGNVYAVAAPGINIGYYLRLQDPYTSRDDVTNGCVYAFYNEKIQKIEPPEIITTWDRFGTCTRVSKDGQRIVIGSYNAERVYVYKYDTSREEFALERTIFPESETKIFGYNLWLNYDGSEMIVGAHDSLFYKGDVYHFKDGVQTHKFEPIEFEGDVHLFGRSVWLSDDGLEAIIGSVGNNTVYAFHYNDGEWIQTHRIKKDDEAFGNSISCLDDNWLIGAFEGDCAFFNDKKIEGVPGSRFGGSVKMRHGFCVIGSFKAEDSWFGYSVDIFPNGNILVGSPMENRKGRFDILTQKQAKERGLFVAPVKNFI